MLAFPVLSDKELFRLTVRLFRNYSKYLVDCARLAGLSKDAVIDKIIHYDGKENLETALAMDKGIILLTAHLGNWELGGFFFGRHGLKINVLTLQDSDIEIAEVRKQYRERHNVATITIGNSPFSAIEMVRALNNKESVAMLIDRYREGLVYIETDFFNRSTKFPKGAFTLARVTGAPIIAAFVVKEQDGYRGIIEKPIIITEEKQEIEALRETVKTLERYIIMYPDQWYNFTRI